MFRAVIDFMWKTYYHCIMIPGDGKCSFNLYTYQVISVYYTEYRVNSIHQNRPKTHCANYERLVLLPRFYATGRLSYTEDGFQSGYRWLSVRGNGPLVAKTLCRREEKSCGLAAILASSSDNGIYVTSSFFPLFSSYALNTSLNDYRFVTSQTPSESESYQR